MHSIRHALACLLLAGLIPAADWYVAPGGNDAAAGSEAEPWRSIGHALTASAAGDRILLLRGGTWRGAFTIGGGRTVAAYGSGDAPMLTASQQAAFTGTWSNPAVRTVAVAGSVGAVWVDGVFCRRARYPNIDADPAWLRIEAGTTNVSIVDSGLKARAAGRFAGAQVRWRRWSWWYETRQITADDGAATLTLANDMPSGTSWLAASQALGNSPDGQGSCYYIDNDLDELDAAGEWFHDGTTLYVYPPAGTAGTTVEWTGSSSGIVSNGATFSGVRFSRFGGTALSVNQPSTVSDCIIDEAEDGGVLMTWSSSPTVMSGCILRDVRNVGIYVNQDPAGPTGTVIERNLLQRIGVERGYGGSGTWHQAGMILGVGNAVAVRLNRIVDTGYCGVIAGSDGQTIDRNILVRTMQTLNDGAAIYTNCSGTTITANIVLDTLGDLSNSHPWWPLGHGIWPEFLSDFHDQVIEDNTVFGSNGDGIMLVNEYTCSVARNVLVDNRIAGLLLGAEGSTAHELNDYGVYEDADDDDRDQGHDISGNLIAVAADSRRLARPENLNLWWLSPYSPPASVLVQHEGAIDYGSMGGSTFVAPASGTGRFAATGPDRSWTTLSTWAAGNPLWAAATTRLATGQVHLLINDTEDAAAMPLPAGTWSLADGTPLSGPLTVQPFRSRAIVTTGALPAAPYTMASGIDWRAANPVSTVLPPSGGSSGGPGGGTAGGSGGGGSGGGSGGGCG
ncbi:MAG: right-handed parallel beta-helix repeat-containing protein, partial [Planctomycetes bacterium]|nr:right-handed parallel beta-helix repeat-containing protein [Planctomycetota bacterium]